MCLPWMDNIQFLYFIYFYKMGFDKNTTILVAVAIVIVIVLIYLWHHHGKSGFDIQSATPEQVSDMILKQTNADIKRANNNPAMIDQIVTRMHYTVTNILISAGLKSGKISMNNIDTARKESTDGLNYMLGQLTGPGGRTGYIYSLNSAIVDGILMHQRVNNGGNFERLSAISQTQEWEANNTGYANQQLANKYVYRGQARNHLLLGYGFAKYTTIKPSAPLSIPSIVLILHKPIKIRGFMLITKENGPKKIRFMSTYDLIAPDSRSKLLPSNVIVDLTGTELPLNPNRTGFGTKWYNINDNSMYVELFDKPIETDKLSLQLESRNDKNMYIHSFVLIL